MIEIKNFNLTLHDFKIESNKYSKFVTVYLHNLERDSGEKSLMSVQFSVPADTSDIDAVRAALKFAVQHEVDECLYNDGERVFDPHKDDTRGILIG